MKKYTTVFSSNIFSNLIRAKSNNQKSSTTAFVRYIKNQIWGFTYLRWSSFLKTSVAEQLTTFPRKIKIIQGTNDRNVSPESGKVLYTFLLSTMRNVELDMINDADHSFKIDSNKNINGWQTVIESDIEWFLK